MKVIYYSYPFFADCDFPLIKSLQNMGIDVHYYMPLYRNFQRSSILEFKRPQRRMGFVRASKMEDMQIYKDCLDLNRLYFISAYPLNKYWIPSWILWIYTLWHMKRLKADIIHIDWQFNNNCFEKFLFSFSLGKKKIMTVHDPIMHSGQPNAYLEEQKRIKTIHWADYYILLNRIQSNEFMEKYSINEKKISYSCLPIYNTISYIKPIEPMIDGDYILFFGQIIPYKGLEFLLEAMIKVHKKFPNLKLVVAGGGKLYFDISKYEKLDYIIWIHQYISIGKLAGLLRKTQFAVCPYKDATQSGVIHTAFAMGIPVIATNVGALAVDVIQNVNGILVPPCDVTSLADSIINLCQNKEHLISLKDNIRNQNNKDERNKGITSDYITIYNKIL